MNNDDEERVKSMRKVTMWLGGNTMKMEMKLWLFRKVNGLKDLLFDNET